jgi:hypothetical protein
MVQSSYKNRKKNRKQSFKRKNTDGNRKVKFIEDKMVGGDGNKQAVAELMLKYKVYPLSGLVLAAFSNAKCASESECEYMATNQSNLSSLQNSVNKCEAILNTLPDVGGKPNVKTWEKNKDLEFINYLDQCIGYILKSVFIPKDLIHNIYIENDQDNNWTTLKNNNFKEVKSVGLGERYSKENAIQQIKYGEYDGKESEYQPTEQQQDRIALNKQITTEEPGESLEDKLNEPYFKNQARQAKEAGEKATLAAEKREAEQTQIPIN